MEIILTAEEKEFRNQYYRDWRKNNKSKVRASNARYWKKYAARKKLEKLENRNN